MNIESLKTIQSDFPVKETVNRLIQKIEEKEWHIFAHIDHAKEARNKGLELRPTQVILFGNPKIGTLLMQDQQSVAIDLPIKALVWEDKDGQVMVAYNTVDWLKERHRLTDDNTLKIIDKILESVCHFATRE
ncbi:MAG: DUF302 domain-containing protein [Aequorivita sp.]